MRRHEKIKPPVKRFRSTIERIGAKGEGVALDPEGGVVYVPYTAPGDVVDIEARGDRGHVIETFDASELRRAAPCMHFGQCGGCSLQHLDLDYYYEWKGQEVGYALHAALGDRISRVSVAPVVRVPAATRRRASLYVDRSETRPKIGFHKRRTRDIVNIETCLILHPKLANYLPSLRQIIELLPRTWRRFRANVTLCDNGFDLDLQPSEHCEVLSHEALQSLAESFRASKTLRLSVDGDLMLAQETPVISFGGVRAQPVSGGFLQASSEAERIIRKEIIGAVSGAKHIADLFSGAGAFSLPLAKTARVSAFDSDARSISALKTAASAHAAELKPLNAQVRNLYERPLTAEELNAFDAVVMDPPRAGAPAQAKALSKGGPKTIVYVSCNPKTFARDARYLIDAGYALTFVTPIDQFVYSSHTELIGVFVWGRR
ncbi:MAG: hypothetical protein AAF850_05735 [Pseudomonadota bacterium]